MLYSDKEILEAVNSKDKKLYKRLYDVYYVSLCRYASKLLHREFDGEEEDVVQEVLIALWEHEGNFKDVQAVTSYLYRSVYNACVNYVRDRKDSVSPEDAAELLSVEFASEENERACRWTVKAYLGKVYHKMAVLGIDTQQNLENAKTYFDDVYEHGPYELESNYADLFGEWVTGSKEAIFQINFIGDASAAYNRGSNRLCPNGSTTGINWTTFAFSYSAYDLQRGFYPGDPRMKTTFMTQWRSYNGNNQSSPKPQVGAELSPNDSTYAYPYLTYTVPGVYILDAEGEPVLNNSGNPVLKQFVTTVPYGMTLDELENLEIPADATAQE